MSIEAKKYFERLRKLLEKCPNGYEVVYSNNNSDLFMCATDTDEQTYSSITTGYDVPSVGYNAMNKNQDGVILVVSKPIKINTRWLSDRFEVSD